MKIIRLRQILKGKISIALGLITLIVILNLFSAVFTSNKGIMFAAFAHDKGFKSVFCSNGEVACPLGFVPMCVGRDAMNMPTCVSKGKGNDNDDDDGDRPKCCDLRGKCDSERIRCVRALNTDCVPPSSGVVSSNLVFYVDAMNIDGSGINFADPTDTTTEWDDLSGRNNDGQLNNFTLLAGANSGWDGENKICNPSVLKFDGNNDFVNIGKPNALNISGSETISTWIKFVDPTMFTYFFGDFSASGIFTQGSLRVGGAGSGIGYQHEHTDGSTLSFDGTTNLSPNTWYNIAVVRNDNAKTVQIYLNGQPYGAQQNYAGKFVISDSDSGNKAIGRAGSFDGNYTNGSIASVRIYHVALTPGQINQNFQVESNRFLNPTPPCQ